MTERVCPVCKCNSFYIKNPDDSYETYEIDMAKFVGKPEDGQPEWCEISKDTVVYCNRCSWHGDMGKLK